MIPYIKVPDFHLGPLPLHPFGLLVATGVLVGTALAMRRARRGGYDIELLNSFITWMLVGGFVGGHVLDSIFYHPDEVLRRPWSLVMLWEGLSSFGGFVGGLIGVLLWKYFEWRPRLAGQRLGRLLRRSSPQPVLPYCDLILSVFPVAWIFGRTGCSVVHDHPGAVAPPGALFAVAYPGARAQVTDGFGTHWSLGPITFVEGHYPRFDLGLLEVMFTVVLALAFALTWRKRLWTGTYVAVVSLSYGPVRFAMDFLRIRDEDGADPRYGGLTPAQWCCVALTLFGLAVAVHVLRLKRRGIDPGDAVRVLVPAAADSA